MWDGADETFPSVHRAVFAAPGLDWRAQVSPLFQSSSYVPLLLQKTCAGSLKEIRTGFRFYEKRHSVPVLQRSESGAGELLPQDDARHLSTKPPSFLAVPASIWAFS